MKSSAFCSSVTENSWLCAYYSKKIPSLSDIMANYKLISYTMVKIHCVERNCTQNECIPMLPKQIYIW